MSNDPRPIIVVKKVTKRGGGHHGGAWKVAYADFVTAMMAFFMVMWIIGMDDSVKGAIESYFQNPVGFQQGGSSGGTPVGLGAPSNPMPAHLVARQIEEQRYREIGEKIEMRLQADDGLGEIAAQVEIVMTEQGLRIELVEGDDGDTFFAAGSATLTTPAARALRIIAGEISPSSAPVVLEGHTDARPYLGSGGYTNWELSTDRANAARRQMESSGLGRDRVQEVRGHADRALRVQADAYDNANRRVSILLPFTH